MRFDIGTVHDFQMYKDKNFDILKDIKILADSAFQGIKKEHVNSVILTGENIEIIRVIGKLLEQLLI